MITLLSRLLIPDHEKTDLPDVRRRYGILSGTVGIFLNLLLVAGKLTAGALAHSVSIVADALNNLSDAASSVITLIGFRIAGKKADKDHPFGHGRFEYIAGLFVSISILLMGLELAKSSVSRILEPRDVYYSGTVVLILAASIAVKLYMFVYNRNLGKRIDSVALHSTAMDSLSDCASTAAVLFCQILCRITGLKLDGWFGLAVSVFILYTGVRTILEATNPLLGRAPDPELTGLITERVTNTDGVLGMHDLLIHDYGPGNLIVSLHAEVPSDLTLVRAHDIIERLETDLDKEFGITSVIHIDPVDSHDKESIRLRKEMIRKVHSMHPGSGLHDFRILRGEEPPAVSFDVIFPYEYKSSDEEIISELVLHLKSECPGYNTIIRVDRM